MTDPTLRRTTNDTFRDNTTNNPQVDMEKLADNLQKLDEESLLHVVELVHEHKSAETYAKNDVESKYTRAS